MKKFIPIILMLLLVGCSPKTTNKAIDNCFYQASADKDGKVLQISVGHNNNFFIMYSTKTETEGRYEKVEGFENVYILKYNDQSQMIVVDEDNGFYFAYPDTTNVNRLEFISLGFVIPTH